VAADGAGELGERFELGSGRPGEPGVEVFGRERGVVELVEDAEFFFEQERSVERLVGLLDFVQQRELADRLFLRRFEQRPAGALDPLALRGVGALVGVPLVAADLVNSALREGRVGPRRGGGLSVAPFPRAARRTRRASSPAPGSPRACGCSSGDQSFQVVHGCGVVA
jgi:hypothetical protein